MAKPKEYEGINSPANTPEQKSLLHSLERFGIDLVQIDVHSNACEICQNYQGKVYSLSGKNKDFPKLEKRPPYHNGCRHIFVPAVETALRIKGTYDKLKQLSNSSIKIKDFRHYESLTKEALMKKCPFCAEEIQDAAIKCKHCGEMLGKSKKFVEDASVNTKAVTKGLKKKEMDDIGYNVGVFFSIVGAVILGLIFHNFWVGLIALFVFGIITWKKWYKE